MASIALLFDLGSTYTKVVAVDLEVPAIVGRSQHPTTADADVAIGLRRALEGVRHLYREEPSLRLCASSARGGLRLVAVGLVPDLTAEAARQTALGAGARIIKVYAHDLTPADIAEIESSQPDLILLAGGTDGGDREVVTRNAAALSKARVASPVIMAGNRVARDDVRAHIEAGGKRCYVTENVLPELGELNVEPARSVIRDVFVKHIVDAKGLDEAATLVDGIVMPTPAAVMAAAKLLSAGTPDEPGFGDLVVIDVGGATTDVHSVSSSGPGPGLIPRGLPEAVATRTVEGDLGVRVNARSVVELAGRNEMRADLAAALRMPLARQRAEVLVANTATLAGSEDESLSDVTMAAACVDLAVERHVGHVEERYSARGPVRFLYGKDLRKVSAMIGVGGVFALAGSADVLRAGLTRDDMPSSMRPEAPALYHDARYVVYALGLLADRYPTTALRLLKRELIRQE